MFILPRGNTISQPSEHLLRESTDAFLKDVYNHYDYIIIDSSPVLAADDTTSLAPKIDATLFVVRLSYTSARLTRKALELLYSRQVNMPGVILNYVDTSLPEYYYYQYTRSITIRPLRPPFPTRPRSRLRKNTESRDGAHFVLRGGLHTLLVCSSWHELLA